MDRVNSVQELIERTQGMPLDKMRFFINEDCKESKCFGIYHDDAADRWVVYKNKANGTRTIRYSGPDEGYAANELWMKLQSEIGQRRAALASAKNPKAERRTRIIVAVATALFISVLLGLFIYAWTQPSRGYYYVNDDLYYYQNSDWYCYDNGGWVYYDAPDGDWYSDGYYSESYPDALDERDAFEHSEYYTAPDSDNDVFDSWDSSDTDWDSDW